MASESESAAGARESGSGPDCVAAYAMRKSFRTVKAQSKLKKIKRLKPYNSVSEGDTWKFLISKSTYFNYPHIEFRDGEFSQKICLCIGIQQAFTRYLFSIYEIV